MRVRNDRGVRNQINRIAELRSSFVTSLLDNDVNSSVHIIAHHTKNRTIITRFNRSGETVSRYFNSVLNGVLRLHGSLLRHPEPVSDNCSDDRWKMFKIHVAISDVTNFVCDVELEALDGTYIKVNVPEIDKPRYRIRKDEIATNVLGCYYLVDASYTNGEGFLAPYRGTRYHLSEWRDVCTPTNHEEYFNMKREMALDPGEAKFDMRNDADISGEEDIIGSTGSSDQWTNWRNELARHTFDERRSRCGQ
nr:uncharacterized protein LOC125423240 [Ziziphus jujuba var. spinosa]